ncbi:hypothetical protein MKW94_015735 [Papaver nudicaule]|uniref:Mitochondrial import inner membrane translocase subunit n=1 Tax=Papaver nudicaule TaxID=74823 RepID=A0AA42AZC7_PAPNU|nr:hypothetical protein [Papaver nudicaule]
MYIGDAMPEEDKMRMYNMIDQLQVRDSLRMYNSLVERCFVDCVDTFRRKSLGLVISYFFVLGDLILCLC